MILKEHEIQKLIIDYLLMKGHFVWRNNTGSFSIKDKYGKSRFFRAGMKGSADIIGISKDGKFIAIEVKSKNKKPSPTQLKFLEDISFRGGIAIVAYSLDDIIDKLLL